MSQIVGSSGPEAPDSVRITSVTDEAVIPTPSQRPMGRLPMRSALLQQAGVETKPPQEDISE